MEYREQWVFPGMPVLSLLRSNPATLIVLERFGIDPWMDPHATLASLCDMRGIRWAELEAELELIPAGRAGADWNTMPLPLLLGHLVSEHAYFLDTLIPAIRMAFTRMPGRQPAPKGLEYFAFAWPAFALETAAHMKEEEVFLFPRLLHYDYCVRHNGRHPDFNGGSVKVFIAIRMLGNEHQQMKALKRFLAEWRSAPESRAVAPDGREELQELLREFQERLEEHSHLEETVVFPRATALEKALYDMAISGTASAGTPAIAPGP
jgi:regulator of cell morphogenesis and NO signaling